MSDLVLRSEASGRVYPGRLGLPINLASALGAPPFYPGRLEFVSRPNSTAGEDGRGKPGRSLRRGVSLIEVMVAMLVALIGVFGVFALIAFAVRQVEIGMNEEAAQTLARNAMNDFEAQGFQDVVNQGGTDNLRWAEPNFVAGPPLYDQVAKDATIDKVYCIDPWGLSQFLLPTDDPFATLTPMEFRNFPFFIPNPLPPPPVIPQIPRITLYDNVGNPFSKALARRLFSGHDDVVTRAPTDDFSGPSQQFFTPDGGRQYSGRFSWQMFVVRKQDNDDYARFFSAVSLTRNADIFDRVFTVTTPVTPAVSNILVSGGGDISLSEITGTQPVDNSLIRRGSWIMLIVSVPLSTTTNDIAFYRVLEAEQTSAALVVPRTFDVTLQGSDMSIPIGSVVSAVLLPSVIAVYERTMKFETSSDWNAN